MNPATSGAVAVAASTPIGLPRAVRIIRAGLEELAGPHVDDGGGGLNPVREPNGEPMPPVVRLRVERIEAAVLPNRASAGDHLLGLGPELGISLVLVEAAHETAALEVAGVDVERDSLTGDETG